LVWHRRPWLEQDLDDASLVFVATDDEALNAHIARLARGLNIWVSVASAPHLGNMQSSAPLLKGPLELTIWSDGAGPALTLRLREALSAWLDGGWVQAAQWFVLLRPSVRALGTAPQRAAVWRALAQEAPALMAQPPQARQARLEALLKGHGLAP
jgi:siroheme synthase-like protein